MPNLNKKDCNVLTLLLVLAILPSACSRAVPPETPEVTLLASRTPAPSQTPGISITPTASGERGTVTLWHSWNEAEAPALVQAIADFQGQFPDILFNVLYIPIEDLQTRYTTAVQEGEGPTLLIGPAEWGPALYNAGLVADLTGHVENGLLQELNGPALGSARYKQALIGLPETMRGVVLYRNKELIPEPPATFDDLVALAKAVTKGDTLGAFLERSFYFSGGHLEGIGGKLMEADGTPAFNNEKGVAWLEMLKAFEQAGPTDYMTDRDLEQFKAGKVGFIIDGTWNRDTLAQAIGAKNLAIDPWPTYPGGHLSGYVQSENLYVSSQASPVDRQAALKFMAYLLSNQVQARLADIGHIPVAAGAQVADPLVAQAMTALAGGTTYPVVPQTPAYNAPMDAALQSIFIAGVQPADALQAANEAVLHALDAQSATPQSVDTPVP